MLFNPAGGEIWSSLAQRLTVLITPSRAVRASAAPRSIPRRAGTEARGVDANIRVGIVKDKISLLNGRRRDWALPCSSVSSVRAGSAG